MKTIKRLLLLIVLLACAGVTHAMDGAGAGGKHRVRQPKRKRIGAPKSKGKGEGKKARTRPGAGVDADTVNLDFPGLRVEGLTLERCWAALDFLEEETKEFMRLQPVEPVLVAENISYQQALVKCIEERNLKGIKEILSTVPGIGYKSLDDKLHCALHYAACVNWVECIDLLVNFYAVPVDIRNVEGFTPLHFAAFNGYCAAVEKLVALGTDASSVGKNGWTLRHFALLNRCDTCVKLLSEK